MKWISLGFIVLLLWAESGEIFAKVDECKIIPLIYRIGLGSEPLYRLSDFQML